MRIVDNTFIKPTVGRVALYKNTNYSDQMMDAHICYLNENGTINISFHNPYGVQSGRMDIELFQGSEEDFPNGSCCWMDYQKKQTEKHNEKSLSEISHDILDKGTSEVGLTD